MFTGTQINQQFVVAQWPQESLKDIYISFFFFFLQFSLWLLSVLGNCSPLFISNLLEGNIDNECNKDCLIETSSKTESTFLKVWLQFQLALSYCCAWPNSLAHMKMSYVYFLKFPFDYNCKTCPIYDLFLHLLFIVIDVFYHEGKYFNLDPYIDSHLFMDFLLLD